MSSAEAAALAEYEANKRAFSDAAEENERRQPPAVRQAQREHPELVRRARTDKERNILTAWRYGKTRVAAPALFDSAAQAVGRRGPSRQRRAAGRRAAAARSPGRSDDPDPEPPPALAGPSQRHDPLRGVRS